MVGERAPLCEGRKPGPLAGRGRPHIAAHNTQHRNMGQAGRLTYCPQRIARIDRRNNGRIPATYCRREDLHSFTDRHQFSIH